MFIPGRLGLSLRVFCSSVRPQFHTIPRYSHPHPPMPTRSTSTTSTNTKPTLFVIIGTTGVGKTKLSIHLSKHLSGEVINADSMQVYQGLDIITNKATMEEREGIPHHLLGAIDPKIQNRYSVVEFVRDAELVIQQLSSNVSDTAPHGKIPIICGGTHYYIQALLFPTGNLAGSLSENSDTFIPSPELSNVKKQFAIQPPCDLDSLNASASHALLTEIDPIMALKWHPADIRRVKRSLEVYYTTGRKFSDILQEQYESLQEKTAGLQSKYRVCFFWLWAEQSVLNERLDARVDTMIELGLFDELKQMRELQNSGIFNRWASEEESVYTKGILQAIGYKEFAPYLDALESKEPVSEKEVAKLRAQCLEQMKASTHRYGRKQVAWIKKKLYPFILQNSQYGNDVIGDRDTKFYVLDATNVQEWDENVGAKALEIAKKFVENRDEDNDVEFPSPYDIAPHAAAKLLPKPSSLEESPMKALDLTQWQKHECPICKDAKTGKPKVFTGDHQWKQHVTSRVHRKQIQYVKRDRSAEEEEARRRRERRAKEKEGKVELEEKDDDGLLVIP